VIESIENNLTNNLSGELNDSFSGVFNSTNTLKLPTESECTANDFEMPIDEEAVQSFNDHIKSLKEESDSPEMRDLIIVELKRQGVIDVQSFLGKGGVDISLRLKNK